MSLPETLQPARVVGIVRETPGTVTVHFTTTPRLQHRAGQYVLLEFRFGTSRYRRAYSLSSLPSDEVHAVTVRLQPGGKISQYINTSLAVGDGFQVSPARGEFVLPDSRAGRQFVFVAGGVGIAPVLPLLQTLLALPQPPPVALLYYSRHADDIVFRDRLDALAAAHPSLRYLPVVTGTRGDWAGLHEAFSVERVLATAGDHPSTLFYVCGPDSLNHACREGLCAAGVPAAAVLVEDFAAAPSPEYPATGFPVTFVRRTLLGQRRARVRGRPGETLLEAAERAGLALPSDCRHGSCGRCRALLLRGEVVMDEPNGLSVAEARDGYILTCVARAAAPVIVKWRR